MPKSIECAQKMSEYSKHLAQTPESWW